MQYYLILPVIFITFFEIRSIKNEVYHSQLRVSLDHILIFLTYAFCFLLVRYPDAALQIWLIWVLVTSLIIFEKPSNRELEVLLKFGISSIVGYLLTSYADLIVIRGSTDALVFLDLSPNLNAPMAIMLKSLGYSILLGFPPFQQGRIDMTEVLSETVRWAHPFKTLVGLVLVIWFKETGKIGQTAELGHQMLGMTLMLGVSLSFGLACLQTRSARVNGYVASTIALPIILQLCVGSDRDGLDWVLSALSAGFVLLLFTIFEGAFSPRRKASQESHGVVQVVLKKILLITPLLCSLLSVGVLLFFGTVKLSCLALLAALTGELFRRKSTFMTARLGQRI